MSPANPHGVSIASDGRVTFRLWAPACDRVKLEIHREGETRPEMLPMESRGDGWHDLSPVTACAGSRYRFVVPNGMRVPDPASRYQPEDVHGPSEVIDPSQWQWSQEWKGRPWEEAVVYELHVGAFTPGGTFQSAIDRLDHLVDLGVTAIEIMPVADFPGRWNWGYDGVLPYAPDSSYGRPEDLKALVEAAHARGLMVLLDVVYNHFGPDGNYLSVYAPQFFTDAHKTAWGAAINFDGPDNRPVREFFIHNALYWVEQFHIDGLRLDAVHAIVDTSPKHILEELAERVRSAVGDRQVHLILENECNQARWLKQLYTAQWNDDVHHTLHTRVTGEDKGYYGEYLGDTRKLGRALAEGFAFQGEVMTYKGGPRGEPSAHLPPKRFVAFLQNHDQVGNRAFGDRIHALSPPHVVRAAAAVYLLLPQIPMLFMGEEWGALQPFPFFCDFGADLAEAVRKGRREEFSRFPEFHDPEQRERIPDPQSPVTFASAKLNWGALSNREHQVWLRWYSRVLVARREAILPLVAGIERAGRYELVGDGAVLVRWRTRDGRDLVLAANLSEESVAGFPSVPDSVIWREGRLEDGGRTLRPWSIVWSIDGQKEERK